MAPMPPVQAQSVVARAPLLVNFDALSIDVKSLNAAAAADLPRDTSINFSLKLLSHLEKYWDARSSLVADDAEGIRLIDYAKVFRSLNERLDATSKPCSDEKFIHQMLELNALIEPDSFSFYAPGLMGEERMLLAAYHDFAIAMVCYKSAAYVDDLIQRQMLFDHTDCAFDKMLSAQRRFNNVHVPTVIKDYAEAIMLKIKIEMERAVHG
jgi:hypothetical protein